MSGNDKREETLFNAALQLATPEERAAHLKNACLDDEPLRQRVLALLQAHDQAATYLDKPAAGLPGKTLVVNPAPIPPTEKAGDKIGRYKLLQQIGEGGCGVVYMAEQEEPVRRRVALKVIKLGMDTKQVIARFEAERQALAMMDHPNIAKVLDAGATETGRPYFVMELVRGIRITDYCDQKNLSTTERLGLFIQVCHAIQHAHQKGIIHRDIKPSNILVADHDGVPVPKVIDFGIAKATQGRLTDQTLFTAFEQFMGTPAYMSPEQAEMSGLDIDTRSDIYSLGVLFYELLTGKTPFDARKLFEAGLDEIRRIIREEEPPRPSQKLSTLAVEEQTTAARHRQTDSPRLLHLVRGDLDWIVMKCLEKDRNRRYETANGLASDLLRHINNEPVMARPPSNVYRFQKLVRRNKVVFAATAMIIVMLVAATGISAWQAVRATRAQTLAEQRLAESEAITKFLKEAFQSPDPARDGRTITVAETLDAAARKLETDLANQPVRRAELEATLANTYEALGLYREAIPLQEKVRDYGLATLGPENPRTLSVMNDLATSYDDAGRRDEALKLREKVLENVRKVYGPESTNTMMALNNLAYTYYEVGRGDEALKLQEEVLALSRKVNDPEHIYTFMARFNLANSYDDAGRRDEALKLREEVLALSSKINGPEHPWTLKAMTAVANSYEEAGRWDEALKLREKALALNRKVNGPEHPLTLLAMGFLATSYDDAGRRSEALKLREEELALSRKVNGPEHPDTLWAMGALATSYDEAGRWDSAIKLREDLLALRRKVNGPESPDTLKTMGNLAYSYDKAGRWGEGIKLFEDLLALRQKVNGPEQPDTLWVMNSLASSYIMVGRHVEAIKLLEEALALSSKIKGLEHPDTFQAMNELAWELATSTNSSVRDGASAVDFAEKAVAGTNRKNYTYLDTLAAAYAEMGRFDKAVATEKQSIALVQDDKEKESAVSRLSLYQTNTPYREP